MLNIKEKTGEDSSWLPEILATTLIQLVMQKFQSQTNIDKSWCYCKSSFFSCHGYAQSNTEYFLERIFMTRSHRVFKSKNEAAEQIRHPSACKQYTSQNCAVTQTWFVLTRCKYTKPYINMEMRYGYHSKIHWKDELRCKIKLAPKSTQCDCHCHTMWADGGRVKRQHI